MRKIYILILLALLPMAASAYDAVIDGIYYNFSGDEAEVTAGSYTGNVVIPSSVTYNDNTYSVTSIGYHAFHNQRNLISVIIPNSVTNIGDYAFDGCSSLTSINIPNGVTTIGSYAFYCTGLISVEIPNSVTSIGTYAFYGCTGLTSITLPNSVTSIGDGVFRSCTALTSITIPEIVTSIGREAFRDCWRLTNITIPENITSLGIHAFRDCKGLTTATINATNIGDEAFTGCSSLSSVTIGSSVTTLGAYVFLECDNITSVTLNSETLVSNNYNNSNGLFYDEHVVTCIIGNSVTSIGMYALAGFRNLTSVTIPNSVTNISNYALSGRMTTITIPSSVTSIGSYAFTSCNALTTVVSKIQEPFEFEGVTIHSSCLLIVPKGTREAYIAAGWTDEYFMSGVVEEEVDVTVTDAGYATFYNEGIDRDIPEGLIAFTATVRNGSVLLTEIEGGKIPANTSVVLKGAADTYCFAYTTSAEATGENQLRVSNGSINADGTQYALTKKNNIVGFYKIKPSLAIPAGKVYLQAPSTGIKEFLAFEEDDATGIDTVNGEGFMVNGPVYNLAGQRLNQAHKGINIINGKKVLF